MNVHTALLLACAVMPALPIAWLRRPALIRALPRLGLLAALVALGAAPLALAGLHVQAGGMVAALAVCLGASDVVTRLKKHLREEAKALPAGVARIIRALQRSIWLCRVTLVFAGLAFLAVPSRGMATTLAEMAAMLAIAGAAALIALWGFGVRQALSDRIHGAEINRLLAWADKEGARDLIHVPDGDPVTLTKIDALVRQLGKQGIKAALVCRGRKAYGKLRGKTGCSILVRTAKDLDDLLTPPFLRCLHLDVGTNSTHMVGLRTLQHVMVDREGRLNGAQAVPKDMRMFDEIRLQEDWTAALSGDAGRYGIALSRITPEMAPPVLPALPIGGVACAGLIIPTPSSGENDLSSLAAAFDVAAALRRKCGSLHLVVALEQGTADGRRLLERTLRPSLGAELTILDTPIDVLNAAPVLIWTPVLDHLLPSFAKRAILRAEEDLASIDFPAAAA